MSRASQIVSLFEKTYADAAEIIMGYLESEGWSIRRGLKIPHAYHPDHPKLKLWFKAQSLYVGERRPEHSLWLDTKKLTEFKSGDVAQFLLKKMKHIGNYGE